MISRNRLEQPDCTSQNVESPWSDGIDHAFGLALHFVGRGAVSGYLLVVDSKEENSEGTSQQPTGIDENGFNIVPSGGCPEHIAGETPDYFAPDEPIELGVCPYLPSQTMGFEYQAPTS